jgi:thiol:disulfide interchange protein DsbD
MLRYLALGLALAASLCPAQINVLRVGKTETVKAKIGSTVAVRVPFELREGYHVNSHTPSDKYLIPLQLTWEPGLLAATAVTFPKPTMEKYAFSEIPLSVFSGTFVLTTNFKVAPTAPPGPTAVNGKLRYQACNNRECLAPRVLDVAIQVDLVR